ncbi:hypothetical protein [Streptomyces sp. NPDC046925]|uniref:hypothetical protein n=1 Tax=Streptomyces sp. NPDC046925 TaxID=3155375 RepID=UPI0033DADD5B
MSAAARFPSTPEPIHVPDAVLEGLGARLRLTRWPDDTGNDDGYCGVRRGTFRVRR